MIREVLIDNLHHNVIYPILISGDAKRNHEIAHDRILMLLQQLEKRPRLRHVINSVFTYHDPRLQTEVAGLNFESPLGIAAGFDKDGIAPNAICTLGFSHDEKGTILPLSQIGEPQPRVFVLPEDRAIINREALPSKGMDFAYEKLSENPPDPGKIRGISAGPNNWSIKEDTAFDDYIAVTNKFLPIAHYIVLNVFCPNTPDLRKIQKREDLSILTGEIRKIVNQYQEKEQKLGNPVRKIPLGVKLSPDQDKNELLDSLDAIWGNVDFVTVANSSTDPSLKAQLVSKYKDELGSTSGRPLTKKILEMSRFIYDETSGKLPIIRSGGVMTPQDYWDALTYGGASLVQLYTAFTDKTTSTPNLAYYMNRSVVGKMKALGIQDLQSVRGMKEDTVHFWAVR